MIHPDYWDRGVAQLLMQQVFGFLPRFLTILMAKRVDMGGTAADSSWTKFSDVPAEEREGMLNRCRALTGKLFEGLDVGVEIRSVAEQRGLLYQVRGRWIRK